MKKLTKDGKNLLHILFENLTVFEDSAKTVFHQLVKDYKLSMNLKDKKGRLPIHYAFENKSCNADLINTILSGVTSKDVLDTLNTTDSEGNSVFVLLFADTNHF